MTKNNCSNFAPKHNNNLEQAALNMIRSGCACLFPGNKIQHGLKLRTNILYNLL